MKGPVIQVSDFFSTLPSFLQLLNFALQLPDLLIVSPLSMPTFNRCTLVCQWYNTGRHHLFVQSQGCCNSIGA
jgi:hypothetical protein